jgi:nitroimidazol reductase NimA-like FMN-containing flavoprotein (pyridoxamine 5'-phosphate oxidase superfamily)
MTREMTGDEWRRFLLARPRTAKLATVRNDGRPHVAPIWFASISTDVDQLRYWAARIGGRYMGPERAGEYGARNAVLGELLVRVEPTTVVARAGIAD